VPEKPTNIALRVEIACNISLLNCTNGHRKNSIATIMEKNNGMTASKNFPLIIIS